jgi:inward rectifier potassium channel
LAVSSTVVSRSRRGRPDARAREVPDPYPRFVARDGRPTVRIRGLHRRRFTDGYHWLMTLSWSRFLLWWVAVYLGTNLLFGVLFWLQPGGIAQARPGSFSDAFFFSVQTLGTIGYGAMWPRSLYAHALVTVEAFSSLALTAVGTGLIFARISRPTARVVFSRCAVVTERNGAPTLMFRGGNTRLNQILEADVSVSIARNGYSKEGVEYRGLTDLKMVRSRSPLVGLTWTIMHVIDETSPLYRATRESLEAEQAELVIVLSGVDDTFAQRIHARHSYLPHEIIWGRRLADIILKAEDGSRYVDYRRFHDLVDAAPQPAGSEGS